MKYTPHVRRIFGWHCVYYRSQLQRQQKGFIFFFIPFTESFVLMFLKLTSLPPFDSGKQGVSSTLLYSTVEVSVRWVFACIPPKLLLLTVWCKQQPHLNYSTGTCEAKFSSHPNLTSILEGRIHSTCWAHFWCTLCVLHTTHHNYKDKKKGSFFFPSTNSFALMFLKGEVKIKPALPVPCWVRDVQYQKENPTDGKWVLQSFWNTHFSGFFFF